MLNTPGRGVQRDPIGRGVFTRFQVNSAMARVTKAGR